MKNSQIPLFTGYKAGSLPSYVGVYSVARPDKPSDSAGLSKIYR